MASLTKMNNFSFLSFIIIGLFVYATYNLYQSLSVEEDDSSQLNNNKESDNDFFNSLSRTLPNIDEGTSDENEELGNEGVIFEDSNIEESNNEEDSSSMKTESNEQEIRDSLTESLNNGFSDGNQETEEIISEKGSSNDREMLPGNEDNDNEDNANIDNTDNIQDG
jgi:hypothetical protein